MCIENGSEVSMKRQGMGMVAALYQTELYCSRYTIHFIENKDVVSFVLTANNSLGFPFLSCQFLQNLF